MLFCFMRHANPFNSFSQLRYNDDLMYDVALKMETDKLADLEVIVPGHRHHRHK